MLWYDITVIPYIRSKGGHVVY